MTWPGVSEYQEAVQSPQQCFKDGELRAGSPVCTKLGLPRPISGGNASVYQIRSGRREFAVRCFLRDVPALRDRYAAIGQHLKASNLKATVGFDYLQEGIRIRGRWVPVLRMEWVRGMPLNDHVAAIRNDAAALRKLADEWQKLMRDLEQKQLAHGDLQHGNVMVADGQLMLIDYDGMYVPALAGQPGLELGHPSYQHPLRSGTDFGLAMDRFSALSIHVAMLALAERPQLWATYDNSDNLLFTRDDLANPDASPLWQELDQTKDAQVRTELQALRTACKAPFAAVPRLEDAIQGMQPAAAVPAAPPTPTKSPTPAPAAVQAKPPSAVASPKGEKPQWLAGLMTTTAGSGAVAAKNNKAPGGPAFALTPSWRDGPSAANASPTAGKPGDNRTFTLVTLATLAQGAVFAIDRSWVIWSLLATGVLYWLLRKPSPAAPASPRTRSHLALASDGRLAALLSGGNVSLFDARSGKRAQRLAPPGGATLACVGIAGGRFATLGSDGNLWLHDQTGAAGQCHKQTGAQLCAAAGDGQVLAFDQGGKVRIVGLDGKERSVLDTGGTSVTALAFARDQQRLAAATVEQRVQFWAVDTRKREHVLEGIGAAITAVAVSANGRFVAAGASSGEVVIWDAKRGKKLHAVRAGTGPVGALAFAPDAAQLLVGGADRALHCFDAITGDVLGRVAGHAAAITAVAVGSDGSQVLTADASGNVYAWLQRRRSGAAQAPKLQAAAP